MNKNTQGVNNGLSVVLEQIYRIMLQYLLLFLFFLSFSRGKRQTEEKQTTFIFLHATDTHQEDGKSHEASNQTYFFVTYTLLCYKTIIKREN